MWDGDQLLDEIRNPEDTTITSASRFAGVVGYLHGRELDAPLAVMDSMRRIPLRDWRGPTLGTVRATGVSADCATGATGSCWQVDWQVDWPAERVGLHLKASVRWMFPAGMLVRCCEEGEETRERQTVHQGP